MQEQIGVYMSNLFLTAAQNIYQDEFMYLQKYSYLMNFKGFINMFIFLYRSKINIVVFTKQNFKNEVAVIVNSHSCIILVHCFL